MAVKRKVKATPKTLAAKPKVETEVTKTAQVEENKKEIRALGKVMLENPGRAPFSIPASPAKIEGRLAEVANAGEDTSAELALLLHEMQSKHAKYISTGGSTSVEEWASARFTLSKQRIKAMIAQAEVFYQLGLEAGHLGGKNRISFTKFRAIVPAVADDLVNKKNVVDILPFLAREGKFCRDVDRITSDVKALKAKALDNKATTDPEALKSVSFKLPAGTAVAAQTLIDAYQTNRGFKNPGEAMFDALTVAAGFYAATDLGRLGGMVNLRNAMATLQPVVPIMYSEDPNLTDETVGLPVVNKVFVVVGVEADCDFQAVMAVDAADAAAHFGVPVSRVREWKLSVTKMLRPAVTYNRDVAAARAPSEEMTIAKTVEVSPAASEAASGVPDVPPAPEQPKAKRTRRTKAQIEADKKATEEAPASPAEPLLTAPEAAETPAVETPTPEILSTPIADADAPTSPAQPDDMEEPVAPSPTDEPGDVISWTFSSDDTGKIVTHDVNGVVTRALIENVLEDESLVVVRHLNDKDRPVGSLHTIEWTSVIDCFDDDGLNNVEKMREELNRIGKVCKNNGTPEILKTIEAEFQRLRKLHNAGVTGAVPKDKEVVVYREVIVFSRKLLLDNKVNIED